jgi:protease inhibitor Inh
MTMTTRVNAASPRPWCLAAIGAALWLAGCSDTVNNSMFDKLAAGPPVPMAARAAQIAPKASDMGGRWVLTMPGTGSCAMTFATGAAEGTVAPEGGCPGRFLASRQWHVEANGVVIRDQSGARLAQLRVSEPGRLEGQTPDGEQVLLGR